MPQLDPTWIVSQVFWLVICFAILFFFFAKLITPRIAGPIEDRQKRIDDDLLAAEKLKQEAESAMKEYEEALTLSNQKANEIVEAMKDELSDYIKKEEEKSYKKLAKKVKASEEKILETKKEALKQVKDIAKTSSSLVLEKLTNTKFDDKIITKEINKLAGE